MHVHDRLPSPAATAVYAHGGRVKKRVFGLSYSLAQRCILKS